MGIAGFYLWLQRWYKNCVEDVPQEIVDAALNGTERPQHWGLQRRFDNLYLDMNGLIHPCCHDTAPLPEPESEEEMFERIFEQLDILYKLMLPRKCLVLCIDGVAPQSKMNQQRSRRFRAAEERLESNTITEECAEKIVSDYGLPRPHTRERWDHNVITPSTSFMERVGLAIEWFVVKKLNEDPAWRQVTVIFSDAHVPGEGEHKIMQYIRGLRAQPGYDPLTSHVIHGMDADLICLGLSTHEEYVTILRNQLTDTFQPHQNHFCCFSLKRYRECLRRDFGAIKNMDFERVLDDFIFLCFFVGNDFLPHVPLISIKTRGIELLLDHYVRSFDDHSYLTEKGEVSFDVLFRFLQSFVAVYMGELKEEYKGLKRAKERAKRNVHERVRQAEKDIQNVVDAVRGCLINHQEASDKLHSLHVSQVKEQTRYVAGSQPLGFSYTDDDYRDAYYQHKFGWDPSNKEEFESNIKRCCGEYFRGSQWVMRYYTKGCPSWKWYYPFHYAPLLEDLASFNSTVNTEMELAAPLHPVEQLLAVLPRLSVTALPDVLHKPVEDPNSVLGPFYPDSVDVDFSEANFSYQGVLRLPFIETPKLQEACRKLVELEPDKGTTLLICHELNPLCRLLDPLLSKSGGKRISIPATLASKVPIAGHIAHYASEWPRHATLDCPDNGIANKTSCGSPIKGNTARFFDYELDTQAEYKAELLRKRAREKDDHTSPSHEALPEKEEKTGSSRKRRSKSVKANTDSPNKRARNENVEEVPATSPKLKSVSPVKKSPSMAAPKTTQSTKTEQTTPIKTSKKAKKTGKHAKQSV